MKSLSKRPLKLFKHAFIFSALIFLQTSCANYKVKTVDLKLGASKESMNTQAVLQRKLAREHWLYRCVPRHRSQIVWYDVGHWGTWAFLGNDDDGIFGEEPTAKFDTSYQVGLPRALLWKVRNPFHNFTFYVIGNAQFRNPEITLLELSSNGFLLFDYDDERRTVFPGDGSGFFFGFHGYKPFISLKLDYGRVFKFYFGWRPRGNFGVKLLPASKR